MEKVTTIRGPVILRYRSNLSPHDIAVCTELLSSADSRSNKGMLSSDETNDGGMKNVAIRARAFILPESFFARIATLFASFPSSWLVIVSTEVMRCFI
jgi:hypothetical protein